jgi:hypothetical protein
MKDPYLLLDATSLVVLGQIYQPFIQINVIREEVVILSMLTNILKFDLVGKVRGHNKSQCNPDAMFSLASPLRPPSALDDIR